MSKSFFVSLKSVIFAGVLKIKMKKYVFEAKKRFFLQKSLKILFGILNEFIRRIKKIKFFGKIFDIKFYLNPKYNFHATLLLYPSVTVTDSIRLVFN